MTLILKLDLDMIKMYLHTKNEVSMSSGSKVIAWTDRNTDRQTHRQTHRHTDMTENITYPHTRVVMTHACQNITFLQLLLRAVTIARRFLRIIFGPLQIVPFPAKKCYTWIHQVANFQSVILHKYYHGRSDWKHQVILMPNELFYRARSSCLLFLNIWKIKTLYIIRQNMLRIFFSKTHRHEHILNARVTKAVNVLWTLSAHVVAFDLQKT